MPSKLAFSCSFELTTYKYAQLLFFVACARAFYRESAFIFSCAVQWRVYATSRYRRNNLFVDPDATTALDHFLCLVIVLHFACQTHEMQRKKSDIFHDIFYQPYDDNTRLKLYSSSKGKIHLKKQTNKNNFICEFYFNFRICSVICVFILKVNLWIIILFLLRSNYVYICMYTCIVYTYI